MIKLIVCGSSIVRRNHGSSDAVFYLTAVWFFQNPYSTFLSLRFEKWLFLCWAKNVLSVESIFMRRRARSSFEGIQEMLPHLHEAFPQETLTDF